MYAVPSHIREASFVTGKGELPTLWYPVLWAHAMSSGLRLAMLGAKSVSCGEFGRAPPISR